MEILLLKITIAEIKNNNKLTREAQIPYLSGKKKESTNLKTGCLKYPVSGADGKKAQRKVNNVDETSDTPSRIQANILQESQKEKRERSKKNI